MPSGPKPKAPGTVANPKQREHQWTPATSVGWQHGKIPTPPTGLMPASRKAWAGWFAAWYASFWQPDDEAMLRQIVTLYDQVERGEFAAMTKLMPLLDRYGITPKGRQDLRWAPPVGEVEPVTDDLADELNKRREARHARLKADAI